MGSVGTNVVSGEVVDIGLSKHRVVLKLRLPQWRGVASNDDELGLAGAEDLESGLVAEDVLAGLHDQLFTESVPVSILSQFSSQYSQQDES